MRFSLRQILYRKNRVEGLSRKAAAIKAGYSPRNTNLDKLMTGADLKLELEIAGLSTRKLAKDIVTGINATNADGQPDWPNRHKYLTTALNIRGELQQADNAQTKIDKAVINIYLPDVNIANTASIVNAATTAINKPVNPSVPTLNTEIPLGE